MVARAIDKQLAKRVGICQHPSLAGGRNAVAWALQPHSVCNLFPQPAWLSGLTYKKNEPMVVVKREGPIHKLQLKISSPIRD